MSLASMLNRFNRAPRSPSREKGEERGRSSSRRRDPSVSSSRAGSSSPLALFRSRTRSPSVGPLRDDRDEDDGDSRQCGISLTIEEPDDDDRSSDSGDDWSDDGFDPQTDLNTERNAMSPEIEPLDPELDFDPLGEGINVVYPKPEPYFGTEPQKRKVERAARREGMVLTTGRPVFSRDCCTITVTHGDPARALETSGRAPKTYVVGSDMSPESSFALDWAIGMVLRDGDELVLITIMESDTKLDNIAATDHLAKLRNQQERETHAYLLARQVNTLLQRTRLQVSVACQAWHAKNIRHMMLDLIDLIDPVMLILGSRGLGQLKGILLGSTSHYLVHRSSVPVMVARRRLKRPTRRTAHLQPRTPGRLADAHVEKEATGRGEDPTAMRAELDAEEQEELRQHHEA